MVIPVTDSFVGQKFISHFCLLIRSVFVSLYLVCCREYKHKYNTVGRGIMNLHAYILCLCADAQVHVD